MNFKETEVHVDIDSEEYHMALDILYYVDEYYMTHGGQAVAIFTDKGIPGVMAHYKECLGKEGKK